MASQQRSSLLPRRLAVMLLFCLIGLKQHLINRPQSGTKSNRVPSDESKNNHAVKVYAPTNSTSNVAICVILKNETLYLDEWIDFHIALGFSPIYIYDNSPDFELNNTPHAGINTWYETRRDIHSHVRLVHLTEPRVQIPAYNRCIKRDAIESTFVALIDIDEFVVLKTFDNVVDFMDHHCNIECGQLSINWQAMGTSNQKQYTPVPVTKRNVHHNGKKSGTIKVIVRPRYVANEMQWRHSVMLKWGFWVDTNGTIIAKKHTHRPQDWERQANKNRPYDVAVLYHYAFKSEGEFHEKTCIRGHSRGEGESQTPMCNNPKYYQLFNGTKFDDMAWRQLTRMVPKYRAYGEATS